MKYARSAVVTGMVLMAAVMFAGCSRNNPIQPTSDHSAFDVLASSPTGAQLNVRVQTCDQLRQMLTVCDRPDTIMANQNCEVVRVQNGQATAASFGDIHPGDSLQVFGSRQQNNYIYAYRLQIKYQEAQGYQVAARVATTDRNRLMLTFQDRPDTCVATQQCECTRQCQRTQFGLDFADIQPGDSVQVFGSRQQDGFIHAQRIKVCATDAGGRWDISFKDTIAAIDYELGTFTVKNRTELITTDENTVVKAVLVVVNPPTDNGKNRGGVSLGTPPQWGQTFIDTLLSFTDLEVGDLVTVHALYVDDQTLLAACITLSDCTNLNQKCVQFTAPIATIEVGTRTVTFDGQAWIGQVCNGAKLIGLDGEELTLADFVIGDLVAVKGFPLSESELRISQMEKVTAL